VPQKEAARILRVVFDTNILISYLFGSRTITRLIDSLEDDAFIPVVSPYLEQEFLGVAARPKIVRVVDYALAREFMAGWVSFAEYVVPRHKVVVCRDKKDNAILECALAGEADYIVTGDSDLLVLENFQGISIVTPKRFIDDVLQLKQHL
jgi:putative PIN family toxin of toxin-antitoxin system